VKLYISFDNTGDQGFRFT